MIRTIKNNFMARGRRRQRTKAGREQYHKTGTDALNKF